MPAKTVPKYGLHRPTGQARVVLDGRTHYLGKHGTDESKQAYQRLISCWLARNQAPPRPTGGFGDLTIDELLLAYLRFAETYYVKNNRLTSEYTCVKCAIRPLQALFGQSQAMDFSPLCFKAVRQQFIDEKLSRKVINKHMGRIKRIFKWGVENELIAGTVSHSLDAVAGLRKGRSGARETVPVKPVPDSCVAPIKPFVSDQVWAMIQLQQLTGMRPGEARIMRGRDLDMSGELWEYWPEGHKTEHHDHVRIVPLGRRAQAIIRLFLKPELDAYLFSPRDAEAQRNEERRRGRKSPMTPSQRKRKPKGRRLNDHYSKDAYITAIQRACDRAFPPPEPLARRDKESVAEWQARLSAKQKQELKDWREEHRWHPNQLRHSSGTKVRKELGLEAAQVWLGHSKADVTQVYAERNLELARQIAAKMG